MFDPDLSAIKLLAMALTRVDRSTIQNKALQITGMVML
jgi:hypothetical protein